MKVGFQCYLLDLEGAAYSVHVSLTHHSTVGLTRVGLRGV